MTSSITGACPIIIIIIIIIIAIVIIMKKRSETQTLRAGCSN